MSIEPHLREGVEALLGQDEEIRHLAGARWSSTWPARRSSAEAVLVATDSRLVALRVRLVWTPGEHQGLEVESVFPYAEMSHVRIDDGTRALSFVCDAREASFLGADDRRIPAAERDGTAWRELTTFIVEQWAVCPTRASGAGDAAPARRGEAISVADLAAIYEAHGMDAVTDADGSRVRVVVDDVAIQVRRVAGSPFLALTAPLRFRDDTTRVQALELCNRVNSRMTMVRCSTADDGDGLVLYADHHLCLEGVVDEGVLAGLPEIFAYLVRAGLDQLDDEALVPLPG